MGYSNTQLYHVMTPKVSGDTALMPTLYTKYVCWKWYITTYVHDHKCICNTLFSTIAIDLLSL